MSWLNVRDRSAYLRMTAVLFMVFAAGGLINPLMSVYVQSVGASTAQIGLTVAVFQAASLASQYWWGNRSDRIGRRKPLVLIGTAGMALGYVATASVNWYGWLFPIRIVEGLAMAAYQAGSLALIGDVLEDEAARGRLMGLYRSLGSLAFAGAALTGGVLADQFGLRTPLLLAASFLALAFLLLLGVRERVVAQPPPAAMPLAGAPAAPERLADVLPRDARARMVLWSFLALSFVWFFGMGSVVSLWPVYMRGVGYTQTYVSGLWALAALGEVPCLMIAGWLADRWGRKWVIIGGVTGMAFVYTAYTLSTTLAWLIPVQMIRSLAYSAFETPAMLYATELGLRRQRGRLSGLYYTASGVGGIAGAALGGAAAQLSGLPPMYRSVALVMGAVALATAWLMPRLRAPSTTEAPAPVPGA
ncbi:MAG: MFS transporter [Chloroflexi bacterium]|nr:MFS transporter [Chloroflexota bacterium]